MWYVLAPCGGSDETKYCTVSGINNVWYVLAPCGVSDETKYCTVSGINIVWYRTFFKGHLFQKVTHVYCDTGTSEMHPDATGKYAICYQH